MLERVKFKNLEIARLKNVGNLVQLVSKHRPDLSARAA